MTPTASCRSLRLISAFLSLLHSKNSEAQHRALMESLRLVAETCRDVGITDELAPRLMNFKPDATAE